MKKIVLSAVLFGSTLSMMAGGYLTNTNQSVTFLRNPAQDASITLGGVYANPAGVNFLPSGFHLGVNLQSAYQTREIQSTFQAFQYGIDNHQSATKTFKADAKAPVIPSLQAAWVNGPLSLQLNLALVGGGGKATYKNGLGSFESKVALLGALGDANSALGFDRYNVDAYMHGRQYFYGLTLGAGYRIGEHFSVYGGLRGILSSAHYDGHLRNISVNGNKQATMLPATEYFGKMSQNSATAARSLAALAATQQQQAIEAGQAALAAQTAGNAALAAQKAAEAQALANNAKSNAAKAQGAGKLATVSGALSKATGDVNIDVHQHGVGLAPIVGAHFHSRYFDVAAKYEFRTRIAFSNDSKNSDNTKGNAQFAQFADDAEVRSDIPALLTLGLQVRPLEALRLNLGYHYYFDKQAKSGIKGAYKNDLLDHGTQEFLAGVEYDLTKQWEISAGMQRTLYPNKDAFMNDVSFNVNSYSVGLGFGYRINDRIKLNAAYFRTFYQNYNKQTADYNNASSFVTLVNAAQNGFYSETDPAKKQAILTNAQNYAADQVKAGHLKGADNFTRTNQVFGISAEFRF